MMGKESIYTPGREASPGTELASTLIWNFPAIGTERKYISVVQVHPTPAQWCFIMTVWLDSIPPYFPASPGFSPGNNFRWIKLFLLASIPSDLLEFYMALSYDSSILDIVY